MTALDYLLANVVYLAVGFTVFFVVLPFGLWIGRVVIISGIERLTE